MVDCEISESDFVAHLRSMGVDTSGLSFGWMLNEYDREGILRWIFTNLDSRNSLSKREACRYAELKDQLLSKEELEVAISDILEKCSGLTLPGDAEGLEKAKRENAALKERLQLLKKHEHHLDMLLKQNELAKEEVLHHISELKEDQVRALAELEAAKTDSLTAAEAVSQREQELFNAVAKHLRFYVAPQLEEDYPKQLMISGPLETYNQKKRQLRTQLKMAAARRLAAKQWQEAADSGSQQADAVAARHAEKRLYEGILSYVETVSEYQHVCTVIQVMSTPVDVHPSRIPALVSERQSSLSLLQQQERLANSQLCDSARRLASAQTRRAACARARFALARSREIADIVSGLHAAQLQSWGMDVLVYALVRREWRRAGDTLLFAEDVREYIKCERSNISARYEAMTGLSQEHRECQKRTETGNSVVAALGDLFQDIDGDSLQQKMDHVKSKTAELREEIEEEFQRKENYLHETWKAERPLVNMVWDGRTRGVTLLEPAVAALLHPVRALQATVDSQLTALVDTFTSLRAKDKAVRRRLWQWFLSDPARLLAQLEELRGQCLG